MSVRNWVWFLASIAVIICDQLSKYEISAWLEPYQPYPLIPMLDLTLAFNTGAAFSFLGSSGPWHHWFFVSLSTFVSMALFVWILRLASSERVQLLGFSLILGGAVGNLIDRLTRGYVIDFIEVYYKNHHFPIFNVADSAITVGVILITYSAIRLKK